MQSNNHEGVQSTFNSLLYNMGKDGNEKGLHVCYSWMVGERRGNQDSVLYSALWPTFIKGGLGFLGGGERGVMIMIPYRME